MFFLSNRNLQNRSIMFQKTSVSEIYGLMLFLTRPKFAAISRRGSNFVSCPIRSSRKLNSRASKN